MLTVDGKRATLEPIRQRLEKPEGAGGLPTTRLELVLAGPRLGDASSLELRDETYAGRLGWKEVIVSAAAGARIASSTAPRRQPVAAAARLSRGRALEPARRDAGARKGRAGRRPWRAAAAHLAGGRGAWLGLRVARHARPRRDRHPPGTRPRALLGRRTRARPRPRQVDRRRLPHRPARNRAPRRVSRRHRHGHAHGGSVRAGRGHAAALGVHRSRKTSTRGSTSLPG